MALTSQNRSVPEVVVAPVQHLDPRLEAEQGDAADGLPAGLLRGSLLHGGGVAGRRAERRSGAPLFLVDGEDGGGVGVSATTGRHLRARLRRVADGLQLRGWRFFSRLGGGGLPVGCRLLGERGARAHEQGDLAGDGVLGLLGELGEPGVGLGGLVDHDHLGAGGVVSLGRRREDEGWWRRS